MFVTEGVNYGPLHSPQGVEHFKLAVADAVAQGGKIEYGGKVCLIHFTFNEKNLRWEECIYMWMSVSMKTDWYKLQSCSYLYHWKGDKTTINS